MASTETLATAVRDAHWLETQAPELVPMRPSSEVLGIGIPLLAQLIDRGDIPAIRTPRRVLIPRQVLLNLLGLQRIAAHDDADSD